MIDADAVWRETLDAVAAVKRGAGAESVHRVRTAAARLVAWLDLGGRRALRDDLRRLRRRAAPVREIDVALARGVPAPMKEWLVAERAARRREFLAGLRRSWFKGLVAAFPLSPPLDRADAEKALADIEGRVRRRAADVSEAAPVESLHRLRRALRRLRHAREWLGEDVDDLRPPLDALGDMNDAATLVRLVHECPMRAQLGTFADEAAVDAETARRRAVDAWTAARFPRRTK